MNWAYKYDGKIRIIALVLYGGGQWMLWSHKYRWCEGRVKYGKETYCYSGGCDVHLLANSHRFNLDHLAFPRLPRCCQVNRIDLRAPCLPNIGREGGFASSVLAFLCLCKCLVVTILPSSHLLNIPSSISITRVAVEATVGYTRLP